MLIPVCTPVLVVACAAIFRVAPVIVVFPGFIPICDALVALPFEPVLIGAALMVLV